MRYILFALSLFCLAIAGCSAQTGPDRGQVVDKEINLQGPWQSGLSEVLIGDHVGIIDRDYNIILPLEYARAIPLSSTHAIINTGSWQSRHYAGMAELDAFESASTYGAFDLVNLKSGEIVRQGIVIKALDRSDGSVFWAKTSTNRNALWGLMTQDGAWVAEPQFEHVQSMHEGLAVVGDPDTRKRGAVNARGEIVVPMIYDNVNYWYNGYGMATKDGQKGILDSKGAHFGGPDAWFEEVNRGKRPKGRRGDQWYYIDTGEPAFEYEDGTTMFQCEQGLNVVYKSDKLQIRNAAGDLVSDTLYPKQHFFRGDCELAFDLSDNERGVQMLTSDGRLFLDPAITRVFDASHPTHGIFAQNGKYGLIRYSDGIVTAKPFTKKLRYSANQLKAGTGNNVYIVDTNGKRVEPPKTDPQAPKLNMALACGNGNAIYNEGEMFGLKSADGVVLVPAEHKAITCKYDHVWLPRPEQNKWCPARLKEMESDRLPPCEVAITPAITMSHSHPERMSDDPHESSVLWTRAYLEYAIGKRETAPRTCGDGVMAIDYCGAIVVAQ